jgi:hypothetical protein
VHGDTGVCKVGHGYIANFQVNAENAAGLVCATNLGCENKEYTFATFLHIMSEVTPCSNISVSQSRCINHYCPKAAALTEDKSLGLNSGSAYVL